jgi:hypothetical protein
LLCSLILSTKGPGGAEAAISPSGFANLEMQCDAINLLFAKHGLPQIAERWTPDE